MYRRTKKQTIEKDIMIREAMHVFANSIDKIVMLNLQTGNCRYVGKDETEREICYEDWQRHTMKKFIHPDYHKGFQEKFDVEILKKNVSGGHFRKSVIYPMREYTGVPSRWIQAEFIACRPKQKCDRAIVYIKKLYGDSENNLIADKRVNVRFLESLCEDLKSYLSSFTNLQNTVCHMMTEGKTDESLRYMRYANKTASRMLSMMSDVVDIFRLKQKGTLIRQTEFDMRELLNSCEDFFHYCVHQKNISYMWAGKPNGRYIGDERLIRQMICNIIDNAIRYNRANGDVRIDVSTESISDIYDRFIVSVRDSGVGMCEEERNNLFLPFAQKKQSDTGIYTRAGVGLSVVKHIAQTLGGTVHVKSEPDIGTEVIVDFVLEKKM